MTSSELPLGARSSGVVVAGYQIRRLLRQPFSGDAVYEAVDVERGRVADLRLVAGRDDEGRRRFVSQAKLLSEVRHPHLPEILAFGQANELLYLAATPLQGVPLSRTERDQNGRPLRVFRLLGGVAGALDAAHSAGLAHGDVRLENVVVVERHVEHPYLVDFALGRDHTDGKASTAANEDDVRALAVTLFRCLTGASPGRAGSPGPRDRRDDLPKALDELLADAMSGPSPGLTAGELISAATRALMTSSTPPARAPTAPTVDAEPPMRAEPAARKAPPRAGGPSRSAAPAPAPLAPTRSARVRQQPRRQMPYRRARRWLGGRARFGPARGHPRRSREVPGVLGVGVVVAAGVAGFFGGRALVEDEGSGRVEDGGVRITLPDGWKAATGVPAIRGLELENTAAAETSNERPALIAGRLPGTRGSVYPAAVADSLDDSPPPPEPVRLRRYEALHFSNLTIGDGRRLALFVAPTSAGTLAVVCLPGAPRTGCLEAAASLELPGATRSPLAEGDRFARVLGREIRRLERRRAPLSARLNAATTVTDQAAAATRLAAVSGAGRRAIDLAQASPAAGRAQARVVSALARLERTYAELSRAAARSNARAFSATRQAVRKGEVRLRGVLRGL